jgi:hypothetical protein
MNMPFTDRLDYLSSMSNNFGYALAVEKLLNIQVPERAEYLRVIMAEFTRISNHLMAIGALLNDLGAYFTPMLYALEERELILDIFEAVSGSRMMCNYFRFGGVARDLPEGIEEKIKDLVFERLPRSIDELDAYLTENEIVRVRCEGVGCLLQNKPLLYSTSGPVLRASGVPYDIRRADPYSIYDRFDFDVRFVIMVMYMIATWCAWKRCVSLSALFSKLFSRCRRVLFCKVRRNIKSECRLVKPTGGWKDPKVNWDIILSRMAKQILGVIMYAPLRLSI